MVIEAMAHAHASGLMNCESNLATNVLAVLEEVVTVAFPAVWE